MADKIHGLYGRDLRDWRSRYTPTISAVAKIVGVGRGAMVADLKAKVFPERELRVLTLKDGRREVRVV